VSRYQKGKTNLDFTGASDSEWQWHQLLDSNIDSINCGVTQGSVMGPQLFLVCVNCVANCVHNIPTKLYADDSSLFVAGLLILSIIMLNTTWLIACGGFCRQTQLISIEKPASVYFV